MLDKIADILISKKDILSLSDLKEIVSIVSDENNLGNSLTNGLHFLSKDEAKRKFNMSDLALEFWYGGYYNKDKAIYLQYDNLYNFCKGKVIDGLTFEEEIIFINLNILLILFNELEHANQINKKSGNSLENIIIREVRESENDDTYAISPIERFANIHAYIQVLELASMLGSSKKIIDELNKSLQNKLIFPYIWLIDNNLSPTIEYFKGMNKDEIIQLLEEEKMKNPDIAFRLVYGLRLTDIEFKRASWRTLDYKCFKDILYPKRINIKSLRPDSMI